MSSQDNAILTELFQMQKPNNVTRAAVAKSRQAAQQHDEAAQVGPRCDCDGCVGRGVQKGGAREREAGVGGVKKTEKQWL
jgi:hypothetical protein